MTTTPTQRVADRPGASVPPAPAASWGPWLFRAALVATLAFFWWLVVYDHGVAPHG